MKTTLKISIRELEEEIIEIEKVRERCKPERKISRLKTQEAGEEEEALIGCGRECGSCGGDIENA